MVKNYFKIAWRNMRRSKGYSALTILGLAMGMAVALLIGLWVYDQYAYDKFLPEYERLYQVRRNYNNNGYISDYTSSSLALADALRNQIPEFENIAETDWMGPHGLMVGDKKLYLPGGQVASNFLKMFRFPLVQGNPGTVLGQTYSIVLTQSTALALFGTQDPMNKTVRFDNQHDLKVTGILKDLPANSTFRFNYLLPFDYLEQTQSYVRQQRASGGFSENSYQVFAQLRPEVSYAQVAPKIKDIEKNESNQNAKSSEVIMQPLARWHLYSDYTNGRDTGGFIEYVRIFSIIGALVLLIACINFINLTTARSARRAKEVGIRKAIGSPRRSLILQFLFESFVLTVFAFLLSLIMVQLALPAFNSLTGGTILIPFASPVFWCMATGCILLTTLISGSRPAFYLSSFQPVKVLKGALLTTRSAGLSRKALVVIQFTCSIALIVSTIVVYRQIQYARDRPTGFQTARLMRTDMNDDLGKNYTALKNELIGKGIAESVTNASSPATDIYWHSGFADWPGKRPGEQSGDIGTIQIGEDYFKTLGIAISSGRDFSGAADSTGIILNESAVKRLHLKQPLNQWVTWNGNVPRKFRIIGVAKDALMLSPFAPPDPTMFFYNPNPSGIIMYRLSPRIKTQDAVVQLTSIFNTYDPAFPFGYHFVDEEYAAKFNLELLVGKLAGIFAGLAVLISCLGLLGLSAYVAEQRTKEIGIRKVLGATVSQVWFLLSKDFILLIVISCLIASPLALYFLQGWLQGYAYHIRIGAGVFIWAGSIALFITLITISFQAIKAAIANPVNSLRTE